MCGLGTPEGALAPEVEADVGAFQSMDANPPLTVAPLSFEKNGSGFGYRERPTGKGIDKAI